MMYQRKIASVLRAFMRNFRTPIFVHRDLGATTKTVIVTQRVSNQLANPNDEVLLCIFI